MKYTAVLLAALSLVSVAQAGLNWGFKGCTEVSSISYDLAMLTIRDHNLIYAESKIMKLIDFAKKVIKSLPSIDCTNLGVFPYDSSTYTDMFISKQTSLYTRMLYFEPITGTEVQYICVDHARV